MRPGVQAEGGMQALSSRNGFGALPLHVAAGRPSVLKVLLEWGADTTATTSIQRTALHEAAYLGARGRCEPAPRWRVLPIEGRRLEHALCTINISSG